VGLYFDGNGGHGFLLSGGVYTNIDQPGAEETYLYGINDKGQIVGAGTTGFLYDLASHSFTPINYPGADASTPRSINNSGTITGFFYFSKGSQIVYDGFTLSGSGYSRLAPLGATATYPYGISASGELVGYAYIHSTETYLNFGFVNGKFGVLTLRYATFPLVYGINPAGSLIVGSYEPATGITGFVYSSGNLQPLSFPGSITTEAYGINSGETVVGYFIDRSNATHGFMWTPSAGK